MTRISFLTLAAVAAQLISVPAGAAEVKADWELKTDNAYFSVYSHNCAPYFYDLAASPHAPSSMEIAIYSDAFRVEYDGDCRAFYLSEIAPRLDSTRIETVVLAGQ
jgi:hypothetical protein